MCGILALVKKNGEAIDESLLVEMRDQMVHRGPDDAGIYISNNQYVGLAHRRLSILDVSSAGHQPMISDKGNVISYNGEIFNYLELKEQYLRNTKTHSSTDTEVLLDLLDNHKEKCLSWLNGMWAFVYMDVENKQLLISRDRYGEKPLYYYEDSNVFIVSSEIKPILKSGYYSIEENQIAVETYLESGLVDGIEDTFFKGIKRFRSGGYGYYRLEDSRFEVAEYYSIEDAVANTDISTEAPIEQFSEIFKDSVKIRMRSDVPLGCCLSGGLDSSSIYAIASQLSAEKLNTFSARFEGKEYDESNFYNSVLKRYAGNSHEVSPDLSDFMSTIRRVVYFLEEPSKALGVYPQWHVMKMASKHVKVILDGQGGDEVLAGYDHYFAYYLADAIVKRPFAVAKELNNIYRTKKNSVFVYLLKAMKTIFSDSTKFRTSYLNRRLLDDVNMSMLPALLKYEDKIGMAFSIEARLPLLDYRLVNFLFSLNENYKISNGWSKHLLRRSMENILPETVRLRKDKKGFPTPYSRILEQHPQLKAHTPNHVTNEWIAWRYAMLKIWREIFIEGNVVYE